MLTTQWVLPNSHQAQQSPTGIMDLGIFALYIAPLLTRLKVFPPTSVLHLFWEQEVTRTPHFSTNRSETQKRYINHMTQWTTDFFRNALYVWIIPIVSILENMASACKCLQSKPYCICKAHTPWPEKVPQTKQYVIPHSIKCVHQAFVL